MSKGSKRRPQQISDAEMERRWGLAFPERCRSCDDPLYDGECKNVDCSEYWLTAERFWSDEE